MPSPAHWLNVKFYKNAVSGFALYDPEEWLPTLNFDISGSFMYLPFLFICMVTIGLTVYLEHFPEHKAEFAMPIDAHVMLGGALSFLVVMRTDASMKRWQDARNSWQVVYSCITNLAYQTAPLLKDDVSTEIFLMQLMAFSMSLKAFLRDTKTERAECGPRMDWRFMRQLNASACPPLQALKLMSETCRTSVPEDGKLTSAIFDEVSEQIRVTNHAVGTMTTIKTTPMTKGYVTTLRSFLILWLATLPLAMLPKYGWEATPVMLFIAYLFLSIEKMAVAIEQPFGDDADDLPQEQYIMEIEAALLEQIPGFEPELDEDDEDDEQAPYWHSLPPGGAARYYMDVPARGPTGGGPPPGWSPSPVALTRAMPPPRVV